MQQRSEQCVFAGGKSPRSHSMAHLVPYRATTEGENIERRGKGCGLSAEPLLVQAKATLEGRCRQASDVRVHVRCASVDSSVEEWRALLDVEYVVQPASERAAASRICRGCRAVASAGWTPPPSSCTEMHGGVWWWVWAAAPLIRCCSQSAHHRHSGTAEKAGRLQAAAPQPSLQYSHVHEVAAAAIGRPSAGSCASGSEYWQSTPPPSPLPCTPPPPPLSACSSPPHLSEAATAPRWRAEAQPTAAAAAHHHQCATPTPEGRTHLPHSTAPASPPTPVHSPSASHLITTTTSPHVIARGYP